MLVVAWYLEMTDATQLRPAGPPRVDARFRLAAPNPVSSRRFYEEVGTDWSWTDRRCWSMQQWEAWVGGPGYEMWVAEVAGEPVGYLELDGGPGGDVDVAYLGILPGFTGLGLGGSLLTAGVDRAWRRGADRVRVHTCSLDAPHARANYLARGFRVYDFVVQRSHRARGAAGKPGPPEARELSRRVAPPPASWRRGPDRAAPGRATPGNPRSPA